MSEFSSSADILSSPSASTLLIYLISQVISPIVDQVTAMATFCFGVQLVQLVLSVQELVRVLHSPLTQLSNLSDYLAFFAPE